MSEGYIKQGKIRRFFEIWPLQQKDVPQVTSLHALVFPDYFLTKMGMPFSNGFTASL